MAAKKSVITELKKVYTILDCDSEPVASFFDKELAEHVLHRLDNTSYWSDYCIIESDVHDTEPAMIIRSEVSKQQTGQTDILARALDDSYWELRTPKHVIGISDNPGNGHFEVVAENESELIAMVHDYFEKNKGAKTKGAVHSCKYCKE